MSRFLSFHLSSLFAVFCFHFLSHLNTFTMNGIMALPNDILSFVLFSFLSTKDLGRLDVAISNHSLRPLLFEIYPSLNLAHEQGTIHRRKMIWFANRSVFPERLVFEYNLIPCELTDIFEMLGQCPNGSSVITHIDLSLCIRNVHVSHIEQMFKFCRNLSTLNLTGYKRVDLFSHALPQLTSLDLSKCQVSDAMAQSIAVHCRSLTTLKLNGCISLTTRAALSLCEGCHSLTSLHLTRCGKLTDATLVALSRSCPGLTVLNLCRVHKITDVGVKAIAQCCPSLTSLNLYGCRKITNASIVALARGCTALSTINIGKCKQLNPWDDNLFANV